MRQACCYPNYKDLLLKSDTIRTHWDAKVEEFRFEKEWEICYHKNNQKKK